jgi:hypothetical protein
VAWSTDVKLPRSVKPQFPTRCIWSGEPDPDAHVTLLTFSIGWHTIIHPSIPGAPFKVRAPIKKEHRWKFLCERYGRVAITFVLAILGVWLVFPHLKNSGHWGRWAGMWLVLLLLLPYILLSAAFPPKFDITAYKDSVVYEFLSPIYAREFAEVNVSDVISIE